MSFAIELFAFEREYNIKAQAIVFIIRSICMAYTKPQERQSVYFVLLLYDSSPVLTMAMYNGFCIINTHYVIVEIL